MRARELLLTRRGRVFVTTTGPRLDDELVSAVALELAELGYAPSERLRARLSTATREELTELRAFMIDALARHLGASERHVPLFRSFPQGVPKDTGALWLRKVLVHYFQAEGQRCLRCGERGVTHVLSPCAHVVCDRCFDGASYGACPICERHVDRDSPFFAESETLRIPAERVVYDRLDLGDDLDDEARRWFSALCARTQPLSPDDASALTALARLDWVPDEIPVRENVALVYGALFARGEPLAVLERARPHLRSATDVLRLVVAASGADPALQGERRVAPVRDVVRQHRWAGERRQRFEAALARAPNVSMAFTVRRFRMAKLGRPVRRALLAVLESFPADRLTEDMLRHRSYWVWLGEWLHPGEHAARFPNTARAFAAVRGDAPFQTWAGRVEGAVADPKALLALLQERPGELARRFDRALRLTEGAALAAFLPLVRGYATPLLFTLRSHLPLRARRAPRRVYWPKGAAARGVFGPDERAPLRPEWIEASVAAIDSELLRRFAAKPRFAEAVIDESLSRVVAPFNERTGASSAVQLPRGSRVPLPVGRVVRMFLHWCQRKDAPYETDVDLSVGFYDEAWSHRGVCSYYQLTLDDVAKSAGDLRDAPWPDGATELVDVDRDRALAAGYRYAVMVVNNYSGQAFSQLERAYAGVMFREDLGGQHFDPRTVALKFAVAGERGVYLPLVLDLRENMLFWLDVQSQGSLQFNSVATSNHAITTICPALMAYFERGARPSMLDVALLHAAARADRVVLRGARTRAFSRRPGETPESFLARLRGDVGEDGAPTLAGPVLAALEHGDLSLPVGSEAWALFRESLTSLVAPSDFLA